MHFTHADEERKSAVDLTPVLRTIEKLRTMTMERGCTKSEAEVAALKIGQAVQRYDLIVQSPQQGRQTSDQQSYRQQQQQRSVFFDDVGAIAETEKAILCVIDDAEIWVPFSQICLESEVNSKGDFGILVVTRWFAERRGLWRGWGGQHEHYSS